MHEPFAFVVRLRFHGTAIGADDRATLVIDGICPDFVIDFYRPVPITGIDLDLDPSDGIADQGIGI